MLAGVLDERRQRPPNDVRIALGERQRLAARWTLDAVEVVRAIAARSTVPVGRIDLVARDREQRVDRVAQARGLRDDRRERLLALLVGCFARRLQRQLGLQLQAGERRAQLVRHLAREALLVTARRGDAREQAVERRRQRGQLVARRAELEAAIEVVRAPVLGAAVICATGSQRAVERAADRERAGEQHERREHERSEQDDLLQPLERRVSRADDDRADDRARCRARGPASARSRMSSGPSTSAALPLRPSVDRRAVERRRRVPRPLDQALPVEHPRAAVERRVVGGRRAPTTRARPRTSSADSCASAFARSTLDASECTRCVEQDVADDEHRADPDGERRQRRQQQPRPKAHRST